MQRRRSARAPSPTSGARSAAIRRMPRLRRARRDRGSASRAGTGTVIDVAHEAGEGPEEADRVLGVEHADDQDERPRVAVLDLGEGLGDDQRRRRDCGRRRARCRSRAGALRPAARRSAAACAPASRRSQARPRSPRRASAQAGAPERRDRAAGIVELMPPGKPRQRQVEEAVLVLIDQPAALGEGHPVAGGGKAGAPAASPRARSSPAPAWSCGATMPGRPRFRMPAFSAAIPASVSPRNFSWSSVTEVMTAASGVVDDVGGVEPAAEPHLEQAEVGRVAREEVEGDRRGDLEQGDRLAAVGAARPRRSRRSASSSSTKLPPPGAPRRMRSWKRTRCGEV